MTLSALNAWGQTSVEYTEQRNPRIRFDRTSATNQTAQTNPSGTHLVPAGIEVIELIRPADVNLYIEIQLATPATTTVSLTSAQIAACVFEVLGNGLYRISGIDSLEEWDLLKSPSITINNQQGNPFSYTVTLHYSNNLSKSYTVQAQVVVTSTLASTFSLVSTADPIPAVVVSIISVGLVTQVQGELVRDGSSSLTAILSQAQTLAGKLRSLEFSETSRFVLDPVDSLIVQLAESSMSTTSSVSSDSIKILGTNSSMLGSFLSSGSASRFRNNTANLISVAAFESDSIKIHTSTSSMTSTFSSESFAITIQSVSITRYGNPVTSTTIKKFGNTSARIQGTTSETGPFIYTESLGADIRSGMIGEWTVEFFMYFDIPPSTNNFNIVPLNLALDTVTQADGVITGFWLEYIKTNNGDRYGWALKFNGNPLSNSGAQTIFDNTQMSVIPLFEERWYHILIKREYYNNQYLYRFFQDGLERDNGFSQRIDYDAYQLVIGGTLNLYNPSQITINRFNGYIDEFRISNSTNRYTGNPFTVTTQPFTDDSYTLLLLHMEGTDLGTTFNDDVTNRLQQATMYSQAQISKEQSKFGVSSLKLDGTGDSIEFDSDSYRWLIYDFCIEFWVRFNSLGSAQNLIDQRTPGGGSNQTAPRLVVSTTGQLNYFVSGANRISSSTNSFVIDTWYHIALARNGTSTRLFIDGVQKGSTYTDNTNYFSDNLIIGADFNQSSSLNGYIDELRLSRTSRYTANFTPSTQSFVSDSDTVLLLDFEGPDQSTIILATK